MRVMLTALALLLAVAPAHAQSRAAKPQVDPQKERAEMQKKKEAAETDKAYKSSLDKIPAQKQQSDPWTKMR